MACCEALADELELLQSMYSEDELKVSSDPDVFFFMPSRQSHLPPAKSYTTWARNAVPSSTYQCERRLTSADSFCWCAWSLGRNKEHSRFKRLVVKLAPLTAGDEEKQLLWCELL